MIDFGILLGAFGVGVVFVFLPVVVWRYFFGWPRKNKRRKNTPFGGDLR